MQQGFVSLHAACSVNRVLLWHGSVSPVIAHVPLGRCFLGTVGVLGQGRWEQVVALAFSTELGDS